MSSGKTNLVACWSEREGETFHSLSWLPGMRIRSKNCSCRLWVTEIDTAFISNKKRKISTHL